VLCDCGRSLLVRYQLDHLAWLHGDVDGAAKEFDTLDNSMTLVYPDYIKALIVQVSALLPFGREQRKRDGTVSDRLRTG
jgi:hypothetical protein